MKNTKKILLFALALVALTLVLSISIFAREIEVTNASQFVAATDWGKNNTKTPTVDDLAVKEGDVIRLMNDITLGSSTYVTVWEGITIDLNGYTLTTSYAYAPIWLKSSGCSVISSRNNPETGKPGKINHTATVCAIKVWQAKEIKDIDIECSRDCSTSKKNIGGIVMQEGSNISIDSITNVNIYGIGLTNGIETYNSGSSPCVIGSMDNVTIKATNKGTADNYDGAVGIKTNATIGTVTNCEIHGATSGIIIWTKAGYNAAITLEDCEVSGDEAALNIKIDQVNGSIKVKADVDTSLESTSGNTIINTSDTKDEGVVNFDVPGYTYVPKDADAPAQSMGTCTHANGYTTYESCAKPSVCVDCGAINPDVAVNHVNVEIEYKAPTADAAGYRRYECSVCGNTSKTIIPARPEHTHTKVEIPAVAAGVNITGYTAGTKCSTCDEVLVKPMVIPATNFKIAARSLAIYETITVNYKCEIPAGYENVYMVFLFDNREITIKDFEIEKTSGRYVFAFTGVTPIFMNENIHATVYAEVDGQVVTNVYEQYSIKQYCVNQLSKSIAPELRTFLIDFMVYGEKAQIMMNHNTGNLVTDGVDVSGKSSFTKLDASYDKRAITGTALDIAEWKTSTLYITNTVNMQFKFVSSDLTGLKIKVTIKDRTQEFDAIKLADTKDSSGRYIVTFANITAIEFNETVTATFWKDGVQIGQTMTYSVNSYIQRNQDLAGSTYATLVDFLKAMYLYGKSAYDLLYQDK